MRSAVNAEDHRVLAIRTPARGLHQPALNLSTVKTLERELLRFDQQ